MFLTVLDYDLKMVRKCIKRYMGRVEGWGRLMGAHDYFNTHKGSASDEPMST